MLAKLHQVFAATVLGGLAISTAAVAGDGATRTLKNKAFQQYATASCGFGSTSCNLTFPPMSYAATLAKAISCLSTATPGAVVGFTLAAAAAEDQAILTPSSIFRANPDELSVSVNASVYMFFNKGDKSYIKAFGSSLTGDLRYMITAEHS